MSEGAPSAAARDSRDSEHVAQSGDPLDMDRLSACCGDVPYLVCLRAEQARALEAEAREQVLRGGGDLRHAEQRRLLGLVDALSTTLAKAQDALAAERPDPTAIAQPVQILVDWLRQQHQLDLTECEAHEENDRFTAEAARLAKALIAAQREGAASRRDTAALREDLDRLRQSKNVEVSAAKPKLRRASKRKAKEPPLRVDTLPSAPLQFDISSGNISDLTAAQAQRLTAFARAAAWHLANGVARRSPFGIHLELTGAVDSPYTARAPDGREISMPDLAGAVMMLHGMEHRTEADPLATAERRIAASLDAGEPPDPADIERVRRAPPPAVVTIAAAPSSLLPVAVATGTGESGGDSGSGGGGSALAPLGATPATDRPAPATAPPQRRQTELG